MNAIQHFSMPRVPVIEGIAAAAQPQNQPIPRNVARVALVTAEIFFVFTAVSTFSFALPALASASWLVSGMGAASMVGALYDGYIACELAWISVRDFLGYVNVANYLNGGNQNNNNNVAQNVNTNNVSFFYQFYYLASSYNGCYTMAKVLPVLREKGWCYFATAACITHGIEACFRVASIIEKFVGAGNYIEGLRQKIYNNNYVLLSGSVIKFYGWSALVSHLWAR